MRFHRKRRDLKRQNELISINRIREAEWQIPVQPLLDSGCDDILISKKFAKVIDPIGGTANPEREV